MRERRWAVLTHLEIAMRCMERNRLQGKARKNFAVGGAVPVLTIVLGRG